MQHPLAFYADDLAQWPLFWAEHSRLRPRLECQRG